MQVSVIIPTYNRARTLLRALNSVLAQKGIAFEVLVVDDGSTDETKRLIDQLREIHSEVLYLQKPNQGPSAARNFGIAEARGKFVAFLDSDDEWLPRKLVTQLRYFEDHPDLLICQTEEIWIRNGRRVNPMKKHKKCGGFIFEKCLPLSLISPSAVMMRREFFREVGLFDESLPACEDYDLWLRASVRFPVGLIEKPYVIRYGGHSDQQSRKFPVMDQFRIRSLYNLLASNRLNQEQRKLALIELEKKCRIVSEGAKKRGKIEEGEYYGKLPQLAETP